MSTHENRNDVASLLREHCVELTDGMTREDIEDMLVEAISLATHNGRLAVLTALSNTLPGFSWLTMLSDASNGNQIAAHAIHSALLDARNEARRERAVAAELRKATRERTF